jgi:hypothetical protein
MGKIFDSSESSRWAIVFDGERHFVGKIQEHDAQYPKRVTLSPFYSYSAEVTINPGGAGINVQRMVLPYDLLAGVEVLECDAKRVVYLDNEDQVRALVRGAEQMARDARAQVSPIQVASAIPDQYAPAMPDRRLA